MRHIGGAVGAVQRELELLTGSGLVRREVRGKQVYFQANQKAAIFPELQGLFAPRPSDSWTSCARLLCRSGSTPRRGGREAIPTRVAASCRTRRLLDREP